MKPIITIDSWDYGIIVDPTIPARNGFSFCAGMDIFSNSGYIQASQALVKETESSTNPSLYTPYWMENFQSSPTATTLQYFFLNSNGELYGDISDTWYRFHANTQTTSRGGLKAVGNTLYYASDAYLGRTLKTDLTFATDASTDVIHIKTIDEFPSTGNIIVDSESISYTGYLASWYSGTALTGCTRGVNGTTGAIHNAGNIVLGFQDTFKTFLAKDDRWHPMEEYLGKLNVGDGRYVATLGLSDGVWDEDALPLPLGFRISSLRTYNDELVIGTYQGNNFWTKNESQLFTWDGTSFLPLKTFNLKEGGISALENWKNYLIVFAGVRGNIYQYNGVEITKIKNIPKIDSDGYGWVNPGSVGIGEGNLLFGLSGPRTDCVPGIYCLGQKQSGDPISLTLKHFTSSPTLTSGDVDGMAILSFGTLGQFYLAHYDSGADDNYKIDKLNTSNKIESGAYVETQNYEVANEYPKSLRGVELVMKNLSIGTTLIKYDLDESGSWTTLGEIDSQNQDEVFYGINDRAKSIQIRIESESNANSTPVIKSLKIY